MNDIPGRYFVARKNIPNEVIYPLGINCSNRAMDNIEIRLENLRSLAVKVGGRPALAERMGMSYQLLQNYIGKNPTKRIGDKTARRAEITCGLPHGWLDHPHADESNVGGVPSGWPFPIERSRYDALPADEQNRIARFVRDTVEAWESKSLEKSKAG